MKRGERREKREKDRREEDSYNQNTCVPEQETGRKQQIMVG